MRRDSSESLQGTYILSYDEEADTIGPLSILLSVRLCSCSLQDGADQLSDAVLPVTLHTIGNTLNNPANRDRTRIEHTGLHSQLSHKIAAGQSSDLESITMSMISPQDTSIRC